jgi:oligopeptide transport system substrate-binding protein
MQRILYFLVIVSLLVACSGPTATPQPAITSTLVSTFTPTVLPTSTNTPEPSSTPTETPIPTSTSTPTVTPTPTKTPVPANFYLSEAGFSLVYPEGYQVSKEENSSSESNGAVASVEFKNSSKGTVVSIFAGADDGSCTLEEMFKQFAKVARQKSGDVTTTDLGAVQLANTVSGQKGQVDWKYPNATVSEEVVVAHHGSRCVVVQVWGTLLQKLDAFRDDMDQIYASLDMTVSRLYGLDRKQALVFLGSIPEAKYLDPATATGGAGAYPGHTFSGLVRLSPQMQIVPDLAESWQISPDGSVYTFTIRSGAAFADGRALVAQDVKDSWERAADPKTKSETARTYLNDIVGVTAKLDGKAEEISGVKVIDDRILVVTLDGLKPFFLAKLTYPTSFIVDSQDIKKSPSDWMFHPNSSGPFVIKEYKKGDALIFERNEKYHTPARMPYVIYLLNRPGNSVSMYQAGEIDVAYLDNTDAKLIQDPGHELHGQLQSVTSLCTYFLYFNNSKPPLDDLNVRKALALSVDRARLNELIYKSMHLVPDAILPPAMPGYLAGQPAPVYDPEAARLALKSSKYAGKLPPITFTTSGYPGRTSQVVEAVINMWKKELGLQVRLDVIDPDVFIRTVSQKKGQVVNNGWCADYPDPQNFLEILFHTGNEFNFAGYSNPQVDQLLDQAGVELDPQKRLEMYQKIEKSLLEDYASLPLFHWQYYSLANPELQGYASLPISIMVADLLYK